MHTFLQFYFFIIIYLYQKKLWVFQYKDHPGIIFNQHNFIIHVRRVVIYTVFITLLRFYSVAGAGKFELLT